MAILAILASMLLPVLSQSQGAGRKAVCQSNQRQLTFASMNYSLDNNNWLNPLQTVPNSSVETTHRVILWDYVAHMPSVFDCPAGGRAVYMTTAFLLMMPLRRFYWTAGRVGPVVTA